LHGSHLLGLALTGLFFAFGRGSRRSLTLLLALELAASCVSPYGPAIVLDAIEHVADPRYRALVREWGPWTADDPLWLLIAPVLCSLLLVLALRPLWAAGPRGRALLACAALLAIASLRSVRFVGDYLLLSAPVIAWGLAERASALSGRAYAAVCGGALLVLVGLVPWGAAQLPPRMGVALGQSLRELAVAERAAARAARAGRDGRCVVRAVRRAERAGGDRWPRTVLRAGARARRAAHVRQ
jgi:hypothetical protein